MKIDVTYIDTGRWGFDLETSEDGILFCYHDNAEINYACCTSADPDTGYISCGCGGEDSVYCYDCKNEYMDNEDSERIYQDGFNR